MIGNATARAATAMRKRLLERAGEVLEADVQDLVLVDGFIEVRGAPAKRVPATDVVPDEGLEVLESFDPGRPLTFSSGCHAAVVVGRSRDRPRRRAAVRDSSRHRQGDQHAARRGSDARRLRARARLRALRGRAVRARRKFSQRQPSRLHDRQHRRGDSAPRPHPHRHADRHQPRGLQGRRRERDDSGPGRHRQRRRRCAAQAQPGRRWSIACRSRPIGSSRCSTLGTEPPLGTPSHRPDLPSKGDWVSTVDWRRNLAALWFAEFTAIFGFSFAFPFLSIFISQDLGRAPRPRPRPVDRRRRQRVRPLDGDRQPDLGHPRRSIRAQADAAALDGRRRDHRRPDLLRPDAGAAGGPSLPAGRDQRHRGGGDRAGRCRDSAQPRRLGAGCRHVGGRPGRRDRPVVGGLAAALFGLRLVFLGGGILLLLSTIPVFLVVRESPLRRRDPKRLGTLGADRPAAGRAASARRSDCERRG